MFNRTFRTGLRLGLVVVGVAAFTLGNGSPGSASSAVGDVVQLAAQYSADQVISVNSSSDDATTCAQSGTICLRNAIATANASSKPVAILFNVSDTIVVTAPLVIRGNGFSPTVTIDGGTNQIAISGGGTSRILSIQNGSTVSLINLTLQNGSATRGGAVLNNNAMLTVTNTTFSNNNADEAGAAIDSEGGTLTVSHSTFTSNTVNSSGAGISSLKGATTLVTDSIFSNNKATHGAGAYLHAGSLTIRNSTFTNNIATDNYGDGGGVFGYNGTLTIVNSSFYGNSANDGGAVFNLDSTLAISNSTFSGNQATNGGGGITNLAPATISNSTISNNAGIAGGGINNTRVAQFSLLSAIVASNTSTMGGPDIISGPAIVSLGHNLIGNTGGASGFVSTDQVNVDAKLGTLGQNGTQASILTVPLLSGSPAIGKGDCGGNTAAIVAALPVSVDARGAARHAAGLGCDVGAFEVGNTAIPTLQPPVLLSKTPVPYNGSVSVPGDNQIGG